MADISSSITRIASPVIVSYRRLAKRANANSLARCPPRREGTFELVCCLGGFWGSSPISSAPCGLRDRSGTRAKCTARPNRRLLGVCRAANLVALHCLHHRLIIFQPYRRIAHQQRPCNPKRTRPDSPSGGHRWSYKARMWPWSILQLLFLSSPQTLFQVTVLVGAYPLSPSHPLDVD